MNKQTRTMVVAGVLALLVAFFYQSTGPSGPTGPAGPILPSLETAPSGQVIVAKLDLKPFAEPIEKKHIKEVPFPAGLVPASAALTTSDVLRKIAVEHVYSDEIISLTRIRDPDAQRDDRLSTGLEPNQRAITIEVPQFNAGGGFLQQGDIVDLVSTFASGGDTFTKTIIQNVRLLIVGTRHQTAVARSNTGAVSAAGGNQRVTIAVDAQTAFRIQHLKRRGQFRMILKNPRDTDSVETKGSYYQKVLEENLPEHFAPKLRTTQKVVPIEVIEGVRQGTQKVVVSVTEREI